MPDERRTPKIGAVPFAAVPWSGQKYTQLLLQTALSFFFGLWGGEKRQGGYGALLEAGWFNTPSFQEGYRPPREEAGYSIVGSRELVTERTCQSVSQQTIADCECLVPPPPMSPALPLGARSLAEGAQGIVPANQSTFHSRHYQTLANVRVLNSGDSLFFPRPSLTQPLCEDNFIIEHLELFTVKVL
ncbi:beta-1,4-galactosyltransferase 3-like [Platysternon megacephalum]|uniref:Beta-1,4-galactosyltransferase 3-like n=1 Tax=Platysternon megacephalum TaxID=55544 RepID=A0A4D9DNM5_9SAUR|nr:beta-1,4-galactosyltransferase 3-like [Platysternon megacephalum]